MWETPEEAPIIQWKKILDQKQARWRYKPETISLSSYNDFLHNFSNCHPRTLMIMIRRQLLHGISHSNFYWQKPYRLSRYFYIYLIKFSFHRQLFLSVSPSFFTSFDSLMFLFLYLSVCVTPKPLQLVQLLTPKRKGCHQL